MNVSNLNRMIQTTVSRDESLGGVIQVTGEVWDFQQSNRGHWFFELRDFSNDSMIKCVCWNNQIVNRTQSIESGQHITILGTLNWYIKKAQMKIKVLQIIKTHSKTHCMARSLELLNTLYQERGWYQRNTRSIVPSKICSVGIVTSRVGAALKDFIRIVNNRALYLEIVVGNTRVQGDVGNEIAAMIRRVAAQKPDCLVLTRGGGSKQDLHCFNLEPVVQAVYECSVPTITGIGHATDTALVDRVADLAVATPTEAAMCVTVNMEDECQKNKLRLQLIKQQIMIARTNEQQIIEARLNQQQILLDSLRTGLDRVNQLLHLKHRIGQQRVFKQNAAMHQHYNWRIRISKNNECLIPATADKLKNGMLVHAKNTDTIVSFHIHDVNIHRNKNNNPPSCVLDESVKPTQYVHASCCVLQKQSFMTLLSQLDKFIEPVFFVDTPNDVFIETLNKWRDAVKHAIDQLLINEPIPKKSVTPEVYTAMCNRNDIRGLMWLRDATMIVSGSNETDFLKTIKSYEHQQTMLLKQIDARHKKQLSITYLND